MFYGNVINTELFDYQDSYEQTIRQATRQTKEYYLKVGTTLPAFIRLLNFYMLLDGRAVYVPAYDRITRSTTLDYYFERLATTTDSEYDRTYNNSLLYTATQREAFNLKDVFAIHLIEVTGQIQDVFERKIPLWAESHEATEQLGISLALKLSPKHRVKVYVRGEHIIVFTTKGLRDESFEYDFKLHRKLWACIPLLRNWINEEQQSECPDIVALCRVLDNPDANNFWTMLNNFCAQNEAIKELKYSTIIQTFNSITTTRRAAIESQINNCARDAENYLNDYARVLESKRTLERRLMELMQTNTAFDTATIKMLVDKKICYNLDINYLTHNDGLISFRCAAPLLSYDKDAARVVYNKRVKEVYSDKLAELFKLLFLDEKAILVFDQAIDVRLTRGTFTARGGNTHIPNDYNLYVPNPHHYHFNCWGSYGPTITKLIHEYKLEEMFYQIKAATGSLNFTDYPVISNFLDQLQNIVEGYYNPHCFYWRDENCTTLHTLEETLQHFREETTE